jgi:hypothetical protein
MIDAVSDVFTSKQIIDRKINPASFGRPKPGKNVMDGVMSQDSNTVIAFKAKGKQSVGHSVYGLLQLRIGKSRVATTQRVMRL